LRPPKPFVQLPLTAGRTAMLVAVTVPELSCAPRAVTQTPCFKAVAVACCCLVYVVVDVVITVTGVVDALGDAPGAGLAALATVKPLALTAVTSPKAPPPKPRPPPGAPEGGVPLGRPEGRTPPGPPGAPPPPAGAQLPFTGALRATLVAVTDEVDEALVLAALRTATHSPMVTAALVAGTVCVIAVEDV
jgi:hypothetical protein